jgi:phosphoglycolate phosphatase
MNIFFDFDGTLIDAKARLYMLFQHLVTESALTFDEYWDLKKNKIGHKEILSNQFNYSNERITEFEKNWMSKIELPEWLDLDKPFDGISEFLVGIAKSYTLYVVTSRQFESNALEQVRKFGWSDLFEKVFVTQQIKEKSELIISEVEITENDWFVGDTGKDIQTGKKLGIKTAAVLSGFLNKEKLLEYEPDLIEADVTKLKFQ